MLSGLGADVDRIPNSGALDQTDPSQGFVGSVPGKLQADAVVGWRNDDFLIPVMSRFQRDQLTSMELEI
jgi:hypothetical protein